MSSRTEHKSLRRGFKIVEEFEAGIMLTGAEVKSAKAGAVNFQGAYVSPEGGELWLKQFHISPYPPAAQTDYSPTRPRKLLMKRSEIQSLLGKLQTEGLTLIPKSLYTRGGLVKISLALAQGLNTRDKRALIKKRDTEKRIRQILRS